MKPNPAPLVLGALRIFCGSAICLFGMVKVAAMPGDLLLSAVQLYMSGHLVASAMLAAYPWLCMYAGGFLALGVSTRVSSFMAGLCCLFGAAASLLATGPYAPGCCYPALSPMPKFASAALDLLMAAAAAHIFIKGSGSAALDGWISAVPAVPAQPAATTPEETNQ